MNKVLFEVNWFGNLYGTGSILMGLCIGVIFLWGTYNDTGNSRNICGLCKYCRFI